MAEIIRGTSESNTMFDAGGALFLGPLAVIFLVGLNLGETISNGGK